MRNASFGLLATLAGVSASWAQTVPAPPPPVVVVQGEGVVRRAPDQAFVRIGAEARSEDPKTAQSMNADAMSAVQQRMIGAGIPKEAVRTVTLTLQQEFDYTGGRQTPRGYVASNAVEVRVDDLARLGEVLDASVGSGATSIQALRFDLKERTTLEREALTRAVADALARAEAAARGAGRAVDRVVRIEESSPGGVVRPMMANLTRVASDAAQTTTPVAEGEVEITVRVTLTATIK